MNQWYETKVKFTKEFTDGTLKRVTETYLFSAVSFTDAEARVYKEIGETVRGEFQVKTIAPKQINEIFYYEDCETWYDAKVDTVMSDADSGKEKKLTYNFLVTAHNLREANDRITASVKGLMTSMEITSVSKSKIVEIFPYNPSDEELEGQEEQIEEEITDENGNSPNINVAYAHDEEE